MALVEKLKNTLAAYAKENGPLEDDVTLELVDIGMTISGCKSYEFSTDYVDANTSWHFEFADDNYQEIAGKLQNGQTVGIKINGYLQATGYVDQISIHSSREGGTTMMVTGRDTLSPACDSHVDPKFEFPATTTLKAILQKLFAPYGFKEILVDDSVNRQKISGSHSVFTTNDDHAVVEKAITSPINNKFKPHPGEGVYEFAERLGKRFGFHIRASADGKSLLVGRPDFKSAPIYKLTHTSNDLPGPNDVSVNNVISSDVTFDWTRQPTVIIAEGSGGGGHFRKQSLKVILVNEILSDNDFEIQAIQDLKKAYSEAIPQKRRDIRFPPLIKVQDKTGFAKLIYAYDDESKTNEQLTNYARRIMADHQSHFCRATYTVNRHSQDGVVWAPNTSVTVKDDISGINQTMWIKGRKFSGSRQGGKRTELELILPSTYQISKEST
jgi:prophage tail gpP-like protein